MEKFQLNEDEVLKRLSNGEMWRICGGTSDGQQTKDCPRVSDSICIELPPLAICYTRYCRSCKEPYNVAFEKRQDSFITLRLVWR